jgi:nicotinate-nucleotide pyrophosphorylase
MTGVKKQHIHVLEKRILEIQKCVRHSMDQVCLGNMTIDEWNQIAAKFGTEHNEIVKQLEQMGEVNQNRFKKA